MAVVGAMLLTPVIPVLAGQAPAGSPSKSDLPPGEGKELLSKNCIGCHQLTVITSQHKTESGWTDTVVEMRSRGANGSDEDMEKIVHYLTANFGPQHSGPSSGSAASASAGSDSAGNMALPSQEASSDATAGY
jgi:mono/diheme cytochrome c family protein